MYLARNEVGPRHHHYVLRESYLSGGVYFSRDLADLGRDPGRFIVYSSETSFHIDEDLLQRLRDKGVTASYSEMEELFFPFIDAYIKNRLQPFHNRHKYGRWQPAAESLRNRALCETHAMDPRRLHFLRLGRTSAETVDTVSYTHL